MSINFSKNKNSDNSDSNNARNNNSIIKTVIASATKTAIVNSKVTVTTKQQY